MFKLIVLVIFALFATVVTAKSSAINEPRVINGIFVNITKAPYTVSVQEGNVHMCGGNIISKDWVITAARCVPVLTDNYTVRAGATYYDEGGSVHIVDQIALPPGSAMNKFGFQVSDLALLHVASSFNFDQTRKAIKLIAGDAQLMANSKVTVYGWANIAMMPPPALHYVSTTVTTKSACNSTFSEFRGIFDNQSCVSTYNLCRKDSGDGINYNDILAGIVSWSEICGNTNYKSIYTELAPYRYWIQRTTGV
ncbi:hypothetical protein PV327_009750 [Microctonus hyperodae]|uniref:Peptidase S1 domain-containing protein n=1 Tax=Microctonus hyperodae TaxID=165561 RepID=A0AA39CB50_MICHY|nr:hypothetical protein PV327_009750 [Microctonus hyperodae]